jgi:hypothetical protein
MPCDLIDWLGAGIVKCSFNTVPRLVACCGRAESGSRQVVDRSFLASLKVRAVSLGIAFFFEFYVCRVQTLVFLFFRRVRHKALSFARVVESRSSELCDCLVPHESRPRLSQVVRRSLLSRGPQVSTTRFHIFNQCFTFKNMCLLSNANVSVQLRHKWGSFCILPAASSCSAIHIDAFQIQVNGYVGGYTS